MRTVDLGTISYRDAWRQQEAVHEQVVAGHAEETLFLLEHLPVITFGRRVADARRNLLAGPDALAAAGVEVVESDRGGDITYHGPGQLVAYPIVKLADHALSVSGYVHQLERIVIDVLAEFGVQAHTDPGAVGVWVAGAKVCAIGVRVRRGVTLHGLALNLDPIWAHFALINPCGLGRPVTSLARLMGERAPMMATLKQAIGRRFVDVFGKTEDFAR